jgi:putative two-component system response regulator
MQVFAIEHFLKNKYEVITASSGMEALKLIYEGIRPDLILLDVIMPDMDGWETFYRLKAISILHGVPIAFLTTVCEETEKKHAYDIGAADFITKPFKEIDLIQRIETIIKNSIFNKNIDYYVINKK